MGWGKQIAFFGIIYCIYVNIRSIPSEHRKLHAYDAYEIDDDDGVCINLLPYAKMHHQDPEEIRRYSDFFSLIAKRYGGYQNEHLPEVQTLPAGWHYALWDASYYSFEKCESRANYPSLSAWNTDGEEYSVGKNNWVSFGECDFLRKNLRTQIKGDYQIFTGWQVNNFGHILHDNLPKLAWLRSVVPENTTFILPDYKMTRQLVTFIDPVFAEEVYWIRPNYIIEVEEGTLSVLKGDNYRLSSGEYGNNMMKHLRRWIFDNHPNQYPMSEKTIVYYSRGSGASHGRTLEKDHEEDVIAAIHHAMERNGRTEKLIIFTGKDENGNTLPIDEQFDIFRHASTIIGPHGSGLANTLWADPKPDSCEERVKVLEIIPGTDSADVQILWNGYYYLFRGMPVDWHQITYAANSTKDTTFIRLPDLDNALDDMWGLNKTVDASVTLG